MSTTRWVVLLRTGHDDTYPYGPFDDLDDANRFAAFMSDEVDPARVFRLQSPMTELLTFLRNRAAQVSDQRPAQWPPSPGDVWEDRHGDRWICTRQPDKVPYLVCIAKQGDDPADHIWALHGPLKLHTHLAPNVEEPPF